MNKMSTLRTALLVGAVVFASWAIAQQSSPSPQAPAAAAPVQYGAPITLEQARKIAEAAEAEARRNQWAVAIAIVDSASQLVVFQRIDGTPYASLDIALGKAKHSVAFKAPTSRMEGTIAGGGIGLRALAINGTMPIEGGIPIVVDGRLIGGIGVSGVLSTQDAQVANAGLAAIAR
jgi:glc operon protein GlcG